MCGKVAVETLGIRVAAPHATSCSSLPCDATHYSRERDRRAPNGATNHNRCGERPDCRQKRFLTPRPSHQNRGNTMQTQRTYQVQHWPNGQWSLEHNWKKVEAASEKEAAEKVCGRALKPDGKLAQLRARVLTLGDLKQRSATPFYDAE
jgi:hypothetical protein